MTKEELEKEADKYADDYATPDLDCSFRAYMFEASKEGYLAGAEPREKRIADLEKENAELKEENGKLLQKITQLEKDVTENESDCSMCDFPKLKQDLEKENAELKEIIKKIEKIFYSGENAIKRLSKISDILAETEQFLKDCDIDNAIQQANKGLDFDKIADEMEQDLKDSEVKK